MSKVFLYKDRFFMEDERLNSPDYFSASITKEADGFSKYGEDVKELFNYWAQFDIGGTNQQNGVSWGFSLENSQDRLEALIHFAKLYIGVKNFYEKLQAICKEINIEEEKKNE